MDSVRQTLQFLSPRSVGKCLLHLLKQDLVACQLGELFLFLDNGSVFIANAAQRIEILRVYRLAENARCEAVASRRGLC